MFLEAVVCLALNVYHEAKNQPMIGQIAVAQVVMNRVEDDRYPDDVCSVVEQGPTYSWTEDFPIRNRCQFSWCCDGKSDVPKDELSWLYARVVAYNVLYDYHKDNTDGATHYHANYVRPWWSKHYDKTVTHGSHIFYK